MEFYAKEALELLKSEKVKMVLDENDYAFWWNGVNQVCSDIWDNDEYNCQKLTEQEFLEKYSDMLFVEVG